MFDDVFLMVVEHDITIVKYTLTTRSFLPNLFSSINQNNIGRNETNIIHSNAVKYQIFLF